MSGGRVAGDPVQRLLALIDIRRDDECWPWLGTLDDAGYGRFWLGKNLRAHRAVVLLLKGEQLTNDSRRPSPSSPRREVRHLCNNRICCNPAHLAYVK